MVNKKTIGIEKVKVNAPDNLTKRKEEDKPLTYKKEPEVSTNTSAPSTKKNMRKEKGNMISKFKSVTTDKTKTISSEARPGMNMVTMKSMSKTFPTGKARDTEPPPARRGPG